jgi:hypothetical protein
VAYGLVVSFGNYFPTMPEEVAFCLGVEWQMINEALKAGRHMTEQFTVHTVNVPLLARLAKSQGLLMEVSECEPVTEGWQVVRFGGAETGGQQKHHERSAKSEPPQLQL